jgi:hypothetical protein
VHDFRVPRFGGVLLSSPAADARILSMYTGSDWQSADITFYGGSDASAP